MIEGLDIVAGTRDHDVLNVYFYIVLHLNPFRASGPTLFLVWRDDFLQPASPIVYLPHVGRMTQVGVCVEGNSRLARLLGSFHSNPLKLILGQLSE